MVWVFLLSGAFLVYVLFGYPLLLAALARRQARPVRKAVGPAKRVSIVLPVHNGERWMARKLANLLALNYPPELLQILVVCDGCTDATESILASSSAGVEVLSVPRGGKAQAINAALPRCRGEILFFTDVRQELDPDCLRHLVACLADPEVGVASGELVIRDGRTHNEVHTGLYWSYEKWIRKRQGSIDSVIGATGCIYAMRASLARPLRPDTILDDVDLPLGAFFAGKRVILDGAALAFDEPASLETEFRRKVRTLAGVYQTIGHFPALLGPANRMWFHFLSHKFSRMLLPWALLTAAVSTAGLPGPWRLAAVAAQSAFYGLAILDRWIPDRLPLKRVSSPARVFCVLMLATAAAVSIWFVPARRLWRAPSS